MPGGGTRRVSGAEFVYQHIREQIIALELAPATRLSEMQLAAELGVSRTPVREGLNRVLSEDLIEQGPTGGVFVRRLEPADLRELYTVRSVLEGVIAREAAEHASEQDIEELRDLMDKMSLLIEHAGEVVRLGSEFHAALSRFAGNRRVSQLMEQIRGHIQRYRNLTTQSPERRRAAVVEHRAICEAITARSGSSAEYHMRLHVENACTEALASVEARLAEPESQARPLDG